MVDQDELQKAPSLSAGWLQPIEKEDRFLGRFRTRLFRQESSELSIAIVCIKPSFNIIYTVDLWSFLITHKCLFRKLNWVKISTCEVFDFFLCLRVIGNNKTGGRSARLTYIKIAC